RSSFPTRRSSDLSSSTSWSSSFSTPTPNSSTTRQPYDLATPHRRRAGGTPRGGRISLALGGRKRRAFSDPRNAPVLQLFKQRLSRPEPASGDHSRLAAGGGNLGRRQRRVGACDGLHHRASGAGRGPC